MRGQSTFFLVAAMAVMPLFTVAPSAAAPMQAFERGYADQGNVEKIARRCRYDRRGRLRCRGVRYRSYPRYYYDPYAYYGYYPRYYGYGFGFQHHHHGFGHGHGHHHGHH